MKEESKLKKMNSEMIITTEIEKAFALSHNLSPIHKKIPSQSVHSEGLLNEIDGSHCSMKTPTFINDIPPKQQFGISNNIFNTHQCKTERHQAKYLSFDIKKREVICLRCNEEGTPDNDLEKLDESCDETIDEVINQCKTNNCLGYPCFVCLDCSGYICFNCLINQHETHKTNSVPYIANSYRDEVNDMYNELQGCVDQLNQIAIESPKKAKKQSGQGNNNKKSEENEQLKQIKSLIPVSNQNILLTINNANDNAYEEYCKSFQSNDKEASDINLVLSKIKSQYSDLADSFKKLIKNLDDPLIKNSDKCELRQKENEVIIKSQSLIKSTTNSLNRLTHLEYNRQKNSSLVLSKQEHIMKSHQAFEDSVVFAIKSGSNNNSIHLNRFKAFIHNSMIYFKTTSIAIKSRHTINLTGLNLCGVYIHKHRLKNPNNELNKLENRDSLDINVSLYKVKGSENIMMLSERKKLYGAVNANDPVISINFSNAVLIEKESEYMVTVDNLNSLSYYGDFWSGSAFSNTHLAKQQELVCNSTGIQVVFSSPLGIQSDFDEFSNGLIEGIIFTTG